MPIRIGRTLSPAAAPLRCRDIAAGLGALFRGSGTVARFEEEVREFYGVRHCFALSSGKAALVLILRALKELHPERDEVLIPAYTCYSVPSAIVRAGLKVRLCDVASASFDFVFDLLEEELQNPRILCVIPTHLYGVPADVDRVKRLARERGVVVVEDAAQAMGGRWQGRRLGTLGDVGLFSMARGKAFSTVEGGLVVTDDEAIGRAVERQLRGIAPYGPCDCLRLTLYAMALSLLIHPALYWLPKLLPFLKLGQTRFDPSFPIRKLSPLQAGMARGWQGKIEELKTVRSRNAGIISGYGVPPAGAAGADIPDLIRFPVLVADEERKKKILRESERMGLGMAGGYPGSIDCIEELKIVAEGKLFPGARDMVERILCLPIHPLVSQKDIRKMVRLL